MDLYAHGYIPITKRFTAESNARTAMWTPAASARIILTDLAISSSINTSFRVEFGTSNGWVIMDHFCQGSTMVYPITGAQIDSNNDTNMGMDCPLVVSFSAAQSNGSTYVLAAGAEARP